MHFLAQESNVRVLGRTMMIDGVRYLSYSGSAIEFDFVGKKIEVKLWTNGANGEEMFKAWMAVFINDDIEPYKRFSLDNENGTYTIYESEKEEKVRIRIVKMSEAAFSKVGIKEIITDSDVKLIPTKEKSRKIEFIGDSITCGYGNEGVWEVDGFSTKQENPWEAYAIKTSRTLDADYHLVSWSGIGIHSSWVDETVNTPLNEWLMPMLYQYTDASICNDLGLPEKEKWEFKKFIPEVIVINLGTNDASYTRNIPERVQAYGDDYYKFLEFVRKNNPDASIICTLGAMGQDLCPEIERRVNQFSAAYNDDNIFFMAFDVQKEEDGIGADWHPSIATHNKMAKKLEEKIREIKRW